MNKDTTIDYETLLRANKNHSWHEDSLTGLSHRRRTAYGVLLFTDDCRR